MTTQELVDILTDLETDRQMPEEPLQNTGSGLGPRGEPTYNFDDNFDLNPEPPCSAELGPIIEKCKQDPNNIPRGHFINAG